MTSGRRRRCGSILLAGLAGIHSLGACSSDAGNESAGHGAGATASDVASVCSASCEWDVRCAEGLEDPDCPGDCSAALTDPSLVRQDYLRAFARCLDAPGCNFGCDEEVGAEVAGDYPSAGPCETMRDCMAELTWTYHL